MKRVFLLLLSIYLLISCAGTQQKGLTLYGEIRTVEAQFTQIFNASRDYLQSRGYKLTKIDFESGVIETGYRNGSGWTYVGFSGTDRRAKVIATVVKIDSVNSSLTLDIFCEVYELSGGWQLVLGDNRAARIMYDRFFEGIFSKAQGRVRR